MDDDQGRSVCRYGGACPLRNHPRGADDGPVQFHGRYRVAAPGRPRGRLAKRSYPGPLRLGAGVELYRLGSPADAPRRRAPPRNYERARLMGRSCPPPRGRGGDGAHGLRDRSHLARGAQDAARVDTRPRLRTLRPSSPTFFFLPVAAIQGRRVLARPRPLHARDRSGRHAFDLPPEHSVLPLSRRGARLDGSYRYTTLAALKWLGHRAHKERRYVHVRCAWARADGVLRHLQGLGYRVGAFEAHAFGGCRVTPNEDRIPQVIQSVSGPVQDGEGMDAVVGVGIAVEHLVPGVEGVLLFVTLVDLAYVVRLREDLVPEVYVGGMVYPMELVRHRVSPYEHPALAHEWLAPVEVEEVTQQHVVDEQEHVGLALNGDDHLLVAVLQGLGVHGVGGAGLHARHPVRGLDALEDPPGEAARRDARRSVVGEEVRLRHRAPLMLRLRHEVEDRGEGGVVEGSLYMKDLYVLVEESAHPVKGAVHSRVRRVHERAGMRKGIRVVVVADGGVGREASVDGLVAAVHRYVVDVDVNEQVALGDTTADADLFSSLRLPDDDVAVRVFGVVVIEPLRVEARHNPVSQAMPELGLRHPAVEAQSRDEVDVLDALRIRLLQNLLDDELPDVRPPHRR